MSSWQWCENFFIIYIVPVVNRDISGVRFGEEPGIDDSHHHRSG